MSKNILFKISLLSVSLFITAAGVFVFVKHQALSATVERPGAASSNIQTFAFPARSGKSTFDVVSLPETDYADAGQKGSAIFSVWDGTSTASNYMNLAHMGRNSDRSDKFLMQFFNQERCIENPDGSSVPGTMLSENFTATFVKPNLTPTPAGSTPTKITIRAYDHFEITWGAGRFTVTITRYWRAINLPTGVTAESFSPNDYFIEQPLPTDVPSALPVTKTLEYTGEFAPFSTRIDHGQPYDTKTFARPADVLVDKKTNKDFNFFDISNEANGEGTSPINNTCQLNADTTVAEKIEPCGCLNNQNVKACGDPYVPFIDLWPPVQFSLSSGTKWQINSVDELSDSVAAYGEQFGSDGSVRLDMNTYDVEPGSTHNITALTSGFQTLTRDLYFSWCFNGKSQQGLVAGGDWITQTNATLATKDADSSGCCDLPTRTPAVDNNHDGLDDDWQLRYGFKLTGKKNYLLPADYDGDSSGSEATTGLPGDGFVADQFLDVTGNRIAITPGTKNATTNAGYITGDGKFTAAEEYIWGTDPIENDSDLDGYPDEADIVGVGQNKIDFLSQLQPREYPTDENPFGNDRYSIKIKTLGRIGQVRDAAGQANSGVPYPNVVRIAEQIRDIFAQDPGDMNVTLTADSESPGLYDDLGLEASVSQGTRQGGNPTFFWYAKRTPGVRNNPGTGQPNGEDAFLQGESLYKVTKTIHDYCPECQPGDKLTFTVQVSDTLRGNVATDSIDVEVGGTNSLQVFQDCNRDGSDDEVGSATYCFSSNEVTKNIPVRVSVAFYNIDSSQYYFQWRLNHTLQTSNCLPVAATSSSTPVPCGFGTSQMLFTPRDNQTTYPIELTVYRNDRNDVPLAQFNPTPSVQVANFTTTIKSGIPAVTIVFEPEPTTKDGGYTVGSTITARAKVDFLDPTPKRQLVADPSVPGSTGGAKALRYVWRNSANEIIKVDEIASVDGSTISLTGDNPAISELFVDVISPDYTSPTSEEVHIVVSGKGLTYFQNATTTGALALLQARLASVLSFVPAPFLKVLSALAAVGLGAVVVIFFATIPQRKQKK